MFGARPLKRAISRSIRSPGRPRTVRRQDTVRVGVIDGNLRFARVADATAVRSRRRCWPASVLLVAALAISGGYIQNRLTWVMEVARS